MSVQAASVFASRSTFGVAHPIASGNMKPPVPRWLHAGDGHPQAEKAVLCWEKLAKSDPAASVFLLPSYALAGCRYPRAPLICARWENGPASPHLRSLAVLVPYDIGLIPGFLRPLTLRGCKVLDSAMLGENSAEALASLADSLIGVLEQRQTDYIVFRDLDIHSPMREAIRQASRQRRFRMLEPSPPVPHWWIRFPEKPEEYWKQFSKKTRYNFRYRAKHLEHTVRCLRTVEEVPEFVQKVQSLIARTWQHRRLEVLFDVEERIEAWKQFAAAGAFRSYLLEQGDRLVAFAMGMQWNGLFTYEETGYDPNDAAKSPGQVLLYRVIEDLIARDTPRLLDFGFGDSEYKSIYANHQTLSGPVAMVRRGFVPLSLLTLCRARAMTGRTARLALNKLGLLSRLRHLHRGHGGVPQAPHSTDSATETK